MDPLYSHFYPRASPVSISLRLKEKGDCSEDKFSVHSTTLLLLLQEQLISLQVNKKIWVHLQPLSHPLSLSPSISRCRYPFTSFYNFSPISIIVIGKSFISRSRNRSSAALAETQLDSSSHLLLLVFASFSLFRIFALHTTRCHRQMLAKRNYARLK